MPKLAYYCTSQIANISRLGATTVHTVPATRWYSSYVTLAGNNPHIQLTQAYLTLAKVSGTATLGALRAALTWFHSF